MDSAARAFNRAPATFPSIRALVEVTTGRSWPIAYRGGGWIVFEPLPQSGILRRIDGLPEISALNSYRWHSLHVAESKPIHRSTGVHEVALMACLAHEDAAILKRDAEPAHNLFRLQIEPNGNAPKVWPDL
jgi:hypothetical protein